MVWWYGALAIVCLAAGLLHVVRLVALRRDVAAEASHAAMGLGMAGMFSPVGDPVPGPVWTAVFAVSAAWFAAVLLRTGGSVAGEPAHHVIGSIAMLFMLAVGHSHAAAPVAGPAGHAAHGGGGDGGLGPASVVAIVLAGYFAWYALHCVDRLRAPSAADGDGPPPGGTRGGIALRAPIAGILSPRVAAVAHLATAVAMAIMLFGSV